MHSSLSHRNESEQREWERYEAKREVALPLTCSGKQHLCLVRDISLGGARLFCPDGIPDDIPDGESIVVEHPVAGAVAVERCWRDQQECGVTFDFSDNALALVSHCLQAMLDLSTAPAKPQAMPLVAAAS